MTDIKMPTVPLNLKQKEKQISVGMGIAGVILLAILAYNTLPLVISLLSMGIAALGKLIVFGAMAAIIATVAAIAMDKSTWVRLRFLYKTLSLKATKLMVKNDPIGFAKAGLQILRERLGTFTEKMTLVNSALKNLERKIEDNANAIAESRERALAANRRGDRKLDAKRYANAAMRKEESNKRLERARLKLEFVYRALKKMREVLNYKIEDEEDRIETIISEYEAMLPAGQAIREGMQILQDSEEKYILDTAVDEMLERIALADAEVDLAMEIFDPLIKNMDFENELALEKAMAKIEEWENEADSILLGEAEKKQLLHETLDPNNLLLTDDVGTGSEQQGSKINRLVNRI